MKPRKHAEVIKAWADGAQIQCRLDDYAKWTDCNPSPLWDICFQYRVKPNTIKYRVGLSNDNGYYAFAINNEKAAIMAQDSQTFVRWLTDWIEVEV